MPRMITTALGGLSAGVIALMAASSLASTLSGTIYDDSGNPFAEAPVQLISDSGVSYQVRSSAEGRYRIEALSAGTYHLSISMPCCAMATFRQPELNVPSEGLEFDVHMVQGDSLNTLGDDPATVADFVRSQQQIPDLDVPRRPDGRTDLSGVYLVGHDPFPTSPQPTEWAAQVSAERIASQFIDAPHTRCLPGGPPIPAGGSPFMGKFVQTDELVLILFEDVPGFRQIFVDGRAHPEDPNPSWMGHSIGQWEGDVLVVDTIGFNDRGWLGPYPMTEAMRMTERYHRTEYGVIELQVSFDDPAVFNEPWVQNRTLDLAPQEELIEYVCENNKWGDGSGSIQSD